MPIGGGLPLWYYLNGLLSMVSGLAMPAVLLFVGHHFDENAKQREDDAREAKDKSEADERSAKEESALIDKSSSELQGVLNLNLHVFTMRSELREACAPGTEVAATKGGQQSCRSRLMNAVHGLDQDMRTLEYLPQTIPLEEEALAAARSLVECYWAQTADDCGLRQSILDAMHGEGVYRDAPLSACPATTPKCELANQRLNQYVLQPIQLKTDVVFCEIALSVANQKIASYQRLSKVSGGDGSAAYALRVRLEAGRLNSICTTKIKRATQAQSRWWP